ncbi:MAG: CopG family antitoxin [Vulcanimicrobiaceae bacterium]
MTKPQGDGPFEKEAIYWDTHDFSEVWAESQPVAVKRLRSFTRGITVRFDEETLDHLRETARAAGVGPTTLIRMWVKERLEHTDRQP